MVAFHAHYEKKRERAEADELLSFTFRRGVEPVWGVRKVSKEAQEVFYTLHPSRLVSPYQALGANNITIVFSHVTYDCSLDASASHETCSIFIQ
jgi:hypothetical protein